MADDEPISEGSRYKPSGDTDDFPTDMGETSMQVASLVQLGKEAYQKESYDLAIKYFNRALDMDPSHKEAKFLKRKTMLTLSRLLEGKSKVEDDDSVDKEIVRVISSDISAEKQKELASDEEKVTSVPLTRSRPTRKERAGVYKPPDQDVRRSGGRVYSIPDTDKKFNDTAKSVAYRSGESLFERRQTRLLILIMAMFLIGVLFASVYFEWITF